MQNKDFWAINVETNPVNKLIVHQMRICRMYIKYIYNIFVDIRMSIICLNLTFVMNVSLKRNCSP